MSRETYAKNSVKVMDKNSSAVVYFRVTTCLNDRQLYYAIGFSGRRSKPDFYYQFNTIGKREEFVRKYFVNVALHENNKRARRNERKESNRGLDVGDIVVASWGYDQTNVDFYQVTRLVGKKSVELRKISSTYTETGPMSGNEIAQKDNFIDEPFTRRAINGGVTVDSVRRARKWDGRPMYSSSYH